MESSAKTIKHVLDATIVLTILGILAFLFVAYEHNCLSSVDALCEYVCSFGVLAPVALAIIRVMQVLVPLVPAPISAAVGSMLFGPVEGFICIYLGNIVGSVAAYYLGRTYGPSLVKALISEKTYDKYVEKVSGQKNFDRFLALAFLIPFFPDDIFCYFAGLGKQNFKTFFISLITMKPWVIMAYCLAFGGVLPFGELLNTLL